MDVTIGVTSKVLWKKSSSADRLGEDMQMLAGGVEVEEVTMTMMTILMTENTEEQVLVVMVMIGGVITMMPTIETKALHQKNIYGMTNS